MKQYACVIWVCDCCMFHHMNGECGDCHEDHGHVREPWNLITDEEITVGMFAELHDCINHEDPDAALPDECDCEIREFSWSSCSGCGSTLHGGRYAFTLWWNEED